MTTKTEKFIYKSKLKHKNRYDYTKVEYINSKTKVKIICNKHGEFEQLPYNHTRGNGCPKCIYNKLDNNMVIKQFKNIHNNYYDYSMTEYEGDRKKIVIICPEHGKFEQLPANHKKGQGCSRCVGKNLTKNEILERLNKKHSNKYQYIIEDNGIKSNAKIKIICPIHGEFKQTLNNHLRGQNCKKCRGLEKPEIGSLVQKFNKVHGYKYTYLNINYVSAHNKIKITCPFHGDFEQTPNNHKNGNGCPACKESNGEKRIRTILIENKIDFLPQYKFEGCKDKAELPFDFYLPKYNTCIEFNGIQHYKPVKYFGGEIGFSKLKKRDKIKKEYCVYNNIPLIIIKYNDKNIEDILRHFNVVK